MKKVAYYNSKMQAEIVAQSLRAQGIEAEVVGAKDYSTFVVGGDLGSYHIHVSEENFPRAEKYVNQTNITEAIAPSPAEPRLLLKKAIVFSFIGMVTIPVVFNVVALMNLVSYRAVETDRGKKQFWSLIVILLQLPAIGILYYLFLNF